MKLPSWHPAYINKADASLPEWHPAFLPAPSVWFSKEWVTINGNHVLIGEDAGGAAAARGAVAGAVAGNTKDNGGATVDVTGHQPKEGYAVSPYKGVETKIKAADFNQSHVEKFMQEHNQLLSKVDHYVGSWYNEGDGHIYLDVSVVKHDASAAVKIARSSNQLAIFNLGNFTEIKADEYGKYEKSTTEEENLSQHQNGSREDHSSYSKLNPQSKEEIIKSLQSLYTLLADFKKGWVTVNGEHMFFADPGESGGKYANVAAAGGYSKFYNTQAQALKLSPAEKAQVGNYKDEGSYLNDVLRDPGGYGENPFNSDYKAMIKSLDTGLQKNTLSADVQLYRAGRLPEGIKAGAVFSDKAYLSTTVDAATMNDFMAGRDKSYIVINAPKGSHALVTNAILGSKKDKYTSNPYNPVSYLDEHEVILPRNSRMQLLGTSKGKDGNNYVHLQLLN